MNDSSKYLIILAGSPRGGEHTWKSVKKFVINKSLMVITIFNKAILLINFTPFKYINALVFLKTIVNLINFNLVLSFIYPYFL